MNLLHLPEIQSGLIPFVSSLIFALVLHSRWPQWSALSALAGFYIGAASMGVLDLTPTRSTNRIFLLGLGFIALGSIVDIIPNRSSNSRIRQVFNPIGLVILAIVISVSWLIYSPLSRQGGMEMVWSLLSAIAWSALIAAGLLTLDRQPIRAYTAITFLALAIGICTALGASIFLGQLAIGLSASCGALLLMACFTNVQRVPFKFIAVAAFLCAAIGVAGVIFAKVTWLTLLLLAGVPLIVRLPLPVAWPRLAQASVVSVFAALAGSLAVSLALWQKAQSTSYY